MSAPDKPARRRRPTLSAALKAAKQAGRPVSSAVVEDGKVTLVFGDDDTSVEAGSKQWDKAIAALKKRHHGKR
jgi:hypothetical protein